MLIIVLLIGWAGWILYAHREWFAVRMIETRLGQCDYDGASAWLGRLKGFLQPANRFWYEGLIAQRSGRLEEAEPAFRAALEAGGYTSGIHTLLGYVMISLQRFKEAEAFLLQAIRTGDVSGVPQNALAEVRLRSGGSLEEALAYADQAIEIASRRIKMAPRPSDHADRARVLARLRRTDEALASLELAVTKPDATPEARANLAWSVGQALLDLGRTEEAYEQFRLGATLDPAGQTGALCLADLRKGGVEFRPVTLSKMPRRFEWRTWWPFAPGSFALALLILMVVVGCSIVVHFTPGTQPDFRASSRVFHLAGGKWVPVPPVDGGVDNVLVSPKGIVWTTTPYRDAILRWDGTRWQRFERGGFVSSFALRGEALWALTSEGVIHYDGMDWHAYRDAINPEWGEAIGTGPSGVWVCDQEGTLAHFDGNSWTRSKLPAIPNVQDWQHRMDDVAPDMQITPQGAVWMASYGLWHYDSSGWKQVAVPNGESAQVVAAEGENVWLLTPTRFLKMQPDGRVAQSADLPAGARTPYLRIAAREGTLWLASAKELLQFDGQRWNHHDVPTFTTVAKAVALASDGSVWVVAEDRPLWQIGQWIGPGLTAAAAILFIFAVLMILWARGVARARRETERLLIKAAGPLPGIDNDQRERALRGQTIALWWQVPAFLIGFPYLAFAVRLKPLLLAPVALVSVWLAYRWWRKRVESPPMSGLHIPLAIGFALLCYFNNPFLWIAAIGIPAAFWMVANKAQDLMRQGDYERALRLIRRLQRVWPTAQLYLQESWTLKNMDRGAEAVLAARKSLSRAAGANPAVHINALCSLAYALTDLCQFVEAQRILENLIELGGEGRFGIADLLLQQSKEPDKALALIEEVQRVSSPRDPAPERAGNKAWALALLGRLEEMRNLIPVALREVNSSRKVERASVHWRVGRAYLAAGQLPEAIEQFRLAAEDDPKGYHGRIAREDLARCSV